MPTPRGYYNLEPGAEYITMNGAALPIAGLSGDRRGNLFHPWGSQNAYLIETRRSTAREILAEKPRPAHVPAPFDESLWK